MAWNTIVLDKYSILDNSELRPFLYRLEGEEKLIVLQGKRGIGSKNSFFERIVDLVRNYGWRNQWQLLIIVPIYELTKEQQGVEWAHTERSILQKLEQEVLEPLEGCREEPKHCNAILYDYRDWNVTGNLDDPAEKARLDIDRSGVIEEERDESVAFTRRDSKRVVEDWPKAEWFTGYNKNLENAELDKVKEKEKYLLTCSEKVTERLSSLIDEKDIYCSELSSDGSFMKERFSWVKTEFQATLTGKVSANSEFGPATARDVLAALLNEAFSISAFCSARRIRLIRCIHEPDKGLHQLVYLLIVLIEEIAGESHAVFGSNTQAYAWGWRAEIEIDDEIFGRSMLDYAARLQSCREDCSSSQRDYKYSLSFIEKSRCPELGRDAEISIEPVRDIKSVASWMKKVDDTKKDFQEFLAENQAKLIEERDKITEKQDIEKRSELNEAQLIKTKQNLKQEELALQGGLRKLSFQDFDTVYTWPQECDKLTGRVQQIFSKRPSWRTRIGVYIVAAVVLFTPLLVTIYKHIGWHGLKQYQSWSLFAFSWALLVVTSLVLRIEERKKLRKIIADTNEHISRNIKTLKEVCRKNRAFLSSVCKLNVVFQNLREIRKQEQHIQLKRKQLEYLRHELATHQDLKICRSSVSITPASEVKKCTIPKKFKPDIRILDVFYPLAGVSKYTIKINTAEERQKESSSMPGLQCIVFFPDYLFPRS